MAYLAQVRYVFPFRLSLSSTMFRVKTEDFTARVRVWSDKADRRLVFRDPKDRIPEQYREVLQARRVSKEKSDELILRTVHINAEDDLIIEEVIDTVGFTRMDVIFECAGDPPSSDSPIFEEIKTKAIGVAQLFLRGYRVASGEVDVKIPGEAASPIVQTLVATDYTVTKEEVVAIFKVVRGDFHWLPASLTGATKTLLSKSQVHELGVQLDEGSVPRLYDELLLEAKELSFVSGNHRLALVIAQTGFETYVQARLIDECRYRKIATLTSKNGNVSDLETAITKGDLRDDLLGTYMTFLVGRSVKDGTEYQEWYKDAYVPRKQIIHQGRANITEPEAKKAFEAIVKYCDYIDRMLTESRDEATK